VSTNLFNKQLLYLSIAYTSIIFIYIYRKYNDFSPLQTNLSVLRVQIHTRLILLRRVALSSASLEAIRLVIASSVIRVSALLAPVLTS
jgi:hypothetical protein